MNKHIKMIGLDLDGTLLTSAKEITPYTREVLTKAIQQGVEVLVSTGRPLAGIPKELMEFPGIRYAVTSNGARVMDTKSGEVIYGNLLPRDIAQQVLSVFADYDALYEVFIDGLGYTKASCMQHLEDYYSTQAMVQYMKETRIPVESVRTVLRESNKDADKVHGVFHYEEERQEAIKRLAKVPGLEVTEALGNNLEVNCEGTNKGIGMLKLGEHLGIKQEEIMACGDGMNDYEMIKTVGFGVAMENADEAVKEVADYVTATNNDEGVAKAIAKFVLE